MKKILVITTLLFFCCKVLFAASITEELTQLNNLYKEGAITEEEFSKAKSILLKTNSPNHELKGPGKTGITLPIIPTIINTKDNINKNISI